MARRAVQLDQDRFCCSICLDLLTVPVSVPCGHNYCSGCIEGYWNQDDQRGRFSCPQCREPFVPRPVLKKNTMLAEVVESLKKTQVQAVTLDRHNQSVLPPLPMTPQPPAGILPAEASQTSHPQRPLLKVLPSPVTRERPNSREDWVVTWHVPVTDLTCAAVDSYQLYAFGQDHSVANNTTQKRWEKLGEVPALPLPAACTVTGLFQAVSTYHFAVRAKDIYGRCGPFSGPQSTYVQWKESWEEN